MKFDYKLIGVGWTEINIDKTLWKWRTSMFIIWKAKIEYKLNKTEFSDSYGKIYSMVMDYMFPR